MAARLSCPPLMRGDGGEVGDAEAVEQLAGAVLGGPVVVGTWRHDGLQYGNVGGEYGHLAEVAHLQVPGVGDGAFLVVFLSGEDAQQGGLAFSVLGDEANLDAAVDDQRQVGEEQVGAEGFFQTFNLQVRCGHRGGLMKSNVWGDLGRRPGILLAPHSGAERRCAGLTKYLRPGADRYLDHRGGRTGRRPNNALGQRAAMASISTRACLGSSLTANAQRAGYTLLKWRA